VATDLAGLVDPTCTVLVTMECQRAVIGDLTPFGALRDAAAAAGVLANGPRLCAAARSAGVRVLHATAERRRDGAGSVANCRMLAASARAGDDDHSILSGTPGAELVAEFGPAPEDLVVPRLHGLTPFTSTSLDQLIRNLGATTVVVVGVSVNIGVLGLVISAVDLGYQVVVVDDAVAGVPLEYGRVVLDNTISLLATMASTHDILTVWAAATSAGTDAG
jgi:biuret amidohydrolase